MDVPNANNRQTWGNRVAPESSYRKWFVKWEHLSKLAILDTLFLILLHQLSL